MGYRGATVRLAGGTLSISTEDITFPQEFEYGKNEAFLKVFVLSYVKFLHDSPIDSEKPRHVILKFVERLTKFDLRDTIKEFSSFADLLLSNEFSTGSDSSTRVFHQFFKHLPIFRECLEWVRTGRPDVLKYVLSFLRFGKKLNYVDPHLDATAFRGWLQVEEKLSTLDFAEDDLASLRIIVSTIVDRLSPDHVLPSFGPGKVSEQAIRDVYDKLGSLLSHPRLAYTFGRPTLGLTEGGMVSKTMLWRGGSSDVARLKFVPKDITKSRSICMEPNAFMYFQQEVLRWMRASFDRSLISRFVRLDDQSINRDAAIHGSTYLSMDTIDLSSASDSVSADLVRKIFPVSWLRYMFGSRTSKVRCPDGSVIVVKKFAPMGSAVCFPVQCVVFTAICLLAYRACQVGKTTGSLIQSSDDVVQLLDGITFRRSAFSPFGKRFEAPVVYGDDIICDSRVTDTVIVLLERFGFSVNTSKSFTKSMSFRESCGVYAFEGQDVTPVIFRLPYFQVGRWDANVYASFIGSINQMRANGYNAVATFWNSILRDYGFKYPLPYVRDPAQFGMFTKNKHVIPNCHLRSNHILPNGECWQIDEERVQGIGQRDLKKKRPNNLDDYRLDQWWRSRTGGDTTSLSERSLLVRPEETRLAPRWARCE